MPSGSFAFGPYRLDMRTKRLLRDGAPVDVSPRDVALLHALVSHAPDVVTKTHLIDAAWGDTAVTESSLTKAMRQLRDRLEPGSDHYIRTVVRLGYTFVRPVTREHSALSDEDLDALMEPHRAFIDGRAALLSLGHARFHGALAQFRDLVIVDAQRPGFHVGLANAAVLIYEATRADAARDVTLLQLAEHHAREACRLDPDLGEAWATLGFVLERTGDRLAALAALHRSVELDPLCARHHLRLALGTWGEDRIAAATTTLKLWPGMPTAHLLRATAFVARDNLPLAARELDAGRAALAIPSSEAPPVALHWLAGLIHLAHGEDEEAEAAFGRERDLEAQGHMYARECCAGAWYATGAIHLRRGNRVAAREAFGEALERVPQHPMARAGMAILASGSAMPEEGGSMAGDGSIDVDRAMACAAVLVDRGNIDAASALVAEALDAAPPGNAGWLLPVDPLLGVQREKDVWSRPLAILRNRAGEWLRLPEG